MNENPPPDPLATDTNPAYTVPSLPNQSQKLTANWGVWSCYWVPVWEWCDHGDDEGHWVDNGYWEYEYNGYSASISGSMTLMPDDIVPTAEGKDMKSGYGVKTDVRAVLSTSSPSGHYTNPQTAFSVFRNSSMKPIYGFCSAFPADAVQNLPFSQTNTPPITGMFISPPYGFQIIPASWYTLKYGMHGHRMACCLSI